MPSRNVKIHDARTDPDSTPLLQAPPQDLLMAEALSAGAVDLVYDPDAGEFGSDPAVLLHIGGTYGSGETGTVDAVMHPDEAEAAGWMMVLTARRARNLLAS